MLHFMHHRSSAANAIKQVTKGAGVATSHLRIFSCATDTPHHLPSLPKVNGRNHGHHVLDTALVCAGAHPTSPSKVNTATPNYMPHVPHAHRGYVCPVHELICTNSSADYHHRLLAGKLYEKTVGVPTLQLF